MLYSFNKYSAFVFGSARKKNIKKLLPPLPTRKHYFLIFFFLLTQKRTHYGNALCTDLRIDTKLIFFVEN